VVDATSAAMGEISVAILDDHPVVREGLRALLGREPDIVVTSESGRVQELLTLSDEPDVIVAELVLSEMRGANLVEALRERFQRSAILVLTMVDELRCVEAALAAGANGYTLKEAAAEDVADAIRKVHRGEGYVEPSLGAALASGMDRVSRGTPTPRLSPREEEVLRLLALGHTNAEIAATLHISLRTAETHRAHVVMKLGMRTRAELVRAALDRGIVR
jgi:two-component system response regulator NreC